MVRALEAIFPGPRRLVLCALFAECARWWTVPQLARKVALPEATVRRHLLVLGAGGVVRSRRAERQATYQPDPACPVFSELQSILRTTSASRAETILVVEDQEATAQITRILLESWGYGVLVAHCASEALDLFQREPERISLLLADVKLPEVSGPQLAVQLTGQRPDLPVVFMSGEPPEDPGCRGAAFLAKPFSPATLARIVRRQLARMNGA